MNLQKEIIFGSDDPTEARLIAKAEKAGKLRKIASKLYTSSNPQINMTGKDIM